MVGYQGTGAGKAQGFRIRIRAVVLNLFHSATHFVIGHNQITHLQLYESLNTHKCNCASGEEQKNADVQISAQNQVKSKKKVITSADVQISAQNKKKGHRCPNRDPQVENHWFIVSCCVSKLQITHLKFSNSPSSG